MSSAFSGGQYKALSMSCISNYRSTIISLGVSTRWSRSKNVKTVRWGHMATL